MLQGGCHLNDWGIRELVDGMPEYQEFMTREELDASSERLAKTYPDCVTLLTIGSSRKGHPLYCLKIGSEGPNALLLGCPHPNEPIGTLMLEYLSEKLASDAALRKKLGYTWYIVKSWDCDGLEENSGWLKGDLTIERYARNFYRPASCQQVDWTFPIDYKTYHYDAPLPETAAIMRLMEEIRPVFLYPLHNSAGFGGAYWFLSEPATKEVYEAIHGAAIRQNIPLQAAGETLSAPIYAPAIFGKSGIRETYDALVSSGVSNISDVLTYGTNSMDYGDTCYHAKSIIAELPYFVAPQLENHELSDLTFGEAKRRGIAYKQESDRSILEILAQLDGFDVSNDPYYLMLEDFVSLPETYVTTDDSSKEEEQRPATKAEVCEQIYISQFFKLLNHGTLIRLLKRLLDRYPQNAQLEALQDQAESLFQEILHRIESGLIYYPASIKSVASVQLECGLLFSQYVRENHAARSA